MIAGQTSRGSNGKQNLLFPLSYMNISQDEGGSYSHEGTYNIDFLGWGVNGRVLKCPYYAPCDLRCTMVSTDTVFWVSTEEVNRINGSVGYVSIMFTHDDNTSIHHVGEIKRQGDLIGHTGTTGETTGDHVHMCVADSNNPQWELMPSGKYQLRNAVHMYNFMGVNGTIIINGYDHNWLKYEISKSKYKRKFKWIIYKKIRNELSQKI